MAFVSPPRGWISAVLVRCEDRRVFGYHGTCGEAADLLSDRAEMLPSAEATDWLGSGSYFFLDHPGQRTSARVRAELWARRRHQDHASGAGVIRATISEDHMLDL
jgi:hypothetical protein